MKGTITKRSDNVLTDLEKDFPSLNTRSSYEEMIRKLFKSNGRSDRPTILRDLYRMFDDDGIEYNRNESDDYYRNLVENTNFQTYKDIEIKMITSLVSKYKSYPSPIDYMDTLVNRLLYDDEWRSDSLRLRILKQFIKYGNYLTAAGYGGRAYIREVYKKKLGKKFITDEEVINFIEDDIFDVLCTADPDDCKKRRRYGLLKAAEDLAYGRFRTGGSTENRLFCFATVYDMTFFYDEKSQIFDAKSDIEKNLFRDYYENNLMWYITQGFESNLGDYAVPSGRGINYKNPAEIIYLYFITHRDTQILDKSKRIQQTLKNSEKMITEVQERNIAQKTNNESKHQSTKFYKDNVFCEDILSKNKDEFKEYIINNYECDARGQNVFTIRMMQNSAYQEYCKIINELKNYAESLEIYNYGLWFTDINAVESDSITKSDSIKEKAKKRADKLAEIYYSINDSFSRDTYKEFWELLYYINNFMIRKDYSRNNNQDGHMPIAALTVPSASEITRTSLIIAFYYYFNRKYEDDRSYKLSNFKNFFRVFKFEADEYLVNSFYQTISSKNVFDVMVVFSAFSYHNF